MNLKLPKFILSLGVNILLLDKLDNEFILFMPYKFELILFNLLLKFGVLISSFEKRSFVLVVGL